LPYSFVDPGTLVMRQIASRLADRRVATQRYPMRPRITDQHADVKRQ
jgi:hypothetical protein